MIDYGAGIGSNQLKYRKISQIARTSLTPPRYSLLLRNMIEYFKSTTVVELGTSLGINTAYLASAANQPNVYTFEGNPGALNIARHILQKEGLDENVHFVLGNIDHTLQPKLPRSVDLAFLDANHTFEATIGYFELVRERCHPGSVIVFDDIYWSKEMTEAWRTIQSNKMVTLSIDLYRFGIIFFNPKITKNHWVIQY